MFIVHVQNIKERKRDLKRDIWNEREIKRERYLMKKRLKESDIS